jgi:DNA-binding NarL/FixJ family response regulator
MKEDAMSDNRCAACAKKLNPREIDVLTAICDGLSNKEIAKVLTVSEKTIKNHTTRLFAKLGVNCRVKAARFAYENGIVRLNLSHAH